MKRKNPFLNWLAGVASGIQNLFWGKKFAFIGRSKTGKTFLREFIINGEIPEGYKHTMFNKTTPYGKKYKIRDFGICIDNIADTSGAHPILWEKAVGSADVIFYFAKATWFHHPEKHGTELRNMKDDVIKMSKWRNNEKRWNRKRMVVVVTHWDQVGHPNLTKADERLQTFPGYGHLEVAIASFGGRKKVPVCIVSLMKENRPVTEEGVYLLLGKLNEYLK